MLTIIFIIHNGTRSAEMCIRDRIYDITLLVLTVLLVMGFICNQLVRPIAEKYAMTAEQQQQAKGMYCLLYTSRCV